MSKMIFIVFTFALLPTQLWAQLDPFAYRGSQSAQFRSPVASEPEICVIGQRLPWADYKKDDAEEEDKLCSYNFHKSRYDSASSGLAVGVCPKLHSTNPGLEVHEIPDDMDKAEWERRYCSSEGRNDNRPGKKLAKYKLSTSCSYTPALLGYYHISRILGGISDVPAAVLRTLDRQYHILREQEAEDALNSLHPGELIDITTSELLRRLKQPSSKYEARLLTLSGQHSYGALQDNPRGEERYSEINSLGRFKRSSYFHLLQTEKSLRQLVGTEFNKSNVQTVLGIKDSADMLIMDYLLGQKDRFGNIHAQDHFYWIERKDDGSLDISDKKYKKKRVEKMEARRAVVVKKMILKDNDCAVNRGEADNVVKQQGLLNHLSHVDPETYQRLLKLKSEIHRSEMREYFQRELLFTERDYRKFAENLEDLADQLYQRCRSGRLLLDLDLEDHFLNQPEDKLKSCELNI